MNASRRAFLQQSMAVAGTFAAAPLSCGDAGAGSSSFLSGAGREFEPSSLELERLGKLESVEKELWEVLRSCRCCPRRCGVNRLKGETGVCSSTAKLKVHSAGAHFGEEKPLVGSSGSGTIFFSNCNLLCCFCQNWQINHRGDGSVSNHDSLAGLMIGLQKRGCHNINLVTPTHVVPHIVKALRIAIRRGLKVPLAYNTGGYDNIEIVKKLDGIVDIYLPDFKYQDPDMAAKYSSGASDYPETAAAAIKEMHRQVGKLRTDSKGIAQRGLMIRHLVMPNNIAGTGEFVRWVADSLTPDTYVNLMAQYRPEHEARDYPQIARRLTTQEWRQALRQATEAGLTNLDR